MKTNFNWLSIHDYLSHNARPLDLALFNFHFYNGPPQAVLDELQNYQNTDGGFGHALEMDCRLPDSTAIATSQAFRIMHELGTTGENDLVQRGVKYLMSSYDESRLGWAIVRPEVDDYPHAPWWGYKAAMTGFGWGNPSADLLGFLIKYGDSEVAGLVTTLKAKALVRIHEVELSDFHEVFNFKALYELADESLGERLKDPLERLIVGAANTNPDEWGSYTATPIKFVSSPNDPFAHLFSKEILQKNVEFVTESLINGDHWEPNWDWDGAYPDDWTVAKREWSGDMTVKNALILKNFGIDG
jgi:hypothetical protein